LHNDFLSKFSVFKISVNTKIPYGKIWRYKYEAEILGKPNAVRAVANANGCNKISLIVPCHRVIATDGSLSGYGGGLDRKRFLLDLEKK
jgi:AraC family transcriptional regulator of adaptative response/methylated-DNA-[protein]-cysteine methyltransferase